MNCTHKRYSAIASQCGFARGQAIGGRVYYWAPPNIGMHYACNSCGEWLPLGPATIAPEVEIEIRAAELAQGWPDIPCTADESLGFRSFIYDGFAIVWQAEFRAGYLAAQILDGEG